MARLSLALLVVLFAGPALAQAPAAPSRVEFTRLVAHWDQYGDDDYLEFLRDARPDVAQFGMYGAHFFGLVHTPQYKGYPAHFPVQGIAECGAWFENRNAQIHKLGVKVVGHMNVKFLVGDLDGPEGPRGFFKFYRDLWDEKELGKKPVDDPLDFLEVDRDGKPITNQNYSIGKMKEYWACLNNPNWRAVLKAWTKRGIDKGVDGFIANYFYRHDCHCKHCQAGFRKYLVDRHTADQLKEKFAIEDLANHRFSEIVSWHKPEESTPLRREMLAFSQWSNKQAFDEVFVEYGRSIKPGLIAAQWNHLGDFNQISGDERCLLPAKVWGQGEDYLWYSAGASGNYTDLAEGWMGEITLQARYVRGAFDDKPFTFGKYEQTRIRAAIAELAANGGAPMGFYTRFKDPASREVIVRYYNFMEKHDGVFRGNRPHAEALLLYPRSQVHAGHVADVEAFKKLGRRLLDEHVLFDVLGDDMPGELTRRQASYGVIFPAVTPAEQVTKILARPGRSDFSKLPRTVRVSASRPAQGSEIDLHLVNYNRQEPEKKHSPGGGIQDEKPIAVEETEVQFHLPAGVTAVRAYTMTPEDPEAAPLEIAPAEGAVKLKIPKFLVYRVVRIETQKRP